MRTSSLVILGLVVALCAIVISAAPEGTRECDGKDTTGKAKREAHPDKKSESKKTTSGGKGSTASEDDEVEDQSKPGDKADVKNYKNKRAANPSTDKEKDDHHKGTGATHGHSEHHAHSTTA